MNSTDSDRPLSNRTRGGGQLSGRRKSGGREREKETDKSGELTWLTYETKLRNLMQELLQPTVKRSREDRELFDTLMHRCETIAKRVDDLETITHKSEVKQTIFDDIFKRINNLDTQRKSDNTEIHEKIKTVEKEMSTIAFDYNYLRENILNIQDVTQKLSEDFTATTVQLDEYKKSYATLAEELQKTIAQHAEFQKCEQIKLEEKLQGTDNSILELRTKVGGHEFTLKATTNTLNELIAKVAIFERDVNESNANITNFAKHIESIKSLKTKIETVEIKSRTIENYLEKYLPIFTQSQISESLHHCLPSTNKRKLMTYEEKRFKDMNNEVLMDDGNPDLQKRIESMYTILETTVKRYARSMAANTLGLKFRDLENSMKEVSMTRIGKSGKVVVMGADSKTTDRNQGGFSGGMESEKTINEAPSNQMTRKKLDVQTDLLFVPMGQEDVDVSSNRESAALEAERRESNKEDGGDSPQHVSPVKIPSKEIRTSDGPEVNTLGMGDEGSDVGSDLDEFQSRQIKKLQDDVAWIKDNHPMNLKKVYEELSERLSRIANSQLEISENATLNVKAAMVEFEKYIKDRQKEELNKVNELEVLFDNVKKGGEVHDRIYQFLRKTNDVVVSLVETINGLLVVSLKEEKEKKSLIGMLQTFQVHPQTQNFTKTSDENSRKKRDTDTSKRFDLPYLPGVKVGSQIDEKTEDFEVKFRYDDKLVTKVEFLELTFDAFKGCLSFSTKYRMASNFAQFYEAESARTVEGSKKLSLKPGRGGSHLIYDEKEKKTIETPKGNPRSFHSRVSSMGYKNYVSEGVGIPAHKRRSPIVVLKDREELHGNRSFY